MKGLDKIINILGTITKRGLEPFHVYYSSYNAIVTNVDDPDSCGRIKVKCTQIFGDEEFPYWVQPLSTLSGPNFGLFLVPPVGSTVTLTFEFGNPYRPRWQHATWKKSDISDGLKEYMREGKYWLFTPKGTKILIDETGDNEIIQITNKEDQGVVIDGKNISIVSDENIFLGSKGEAAEPALLGETTLDYISNLHDILSQLTVGTAFGPSSTPINIADILQNQQLLAQAQSNKVKLD